MYILWIWMLYIRTIERGCILFIEKINYILQADGNTFKRLQYMKDA